MPEYVEVHAELIKHPKMERLRRILKTPAVHLQGHLTALWQWAMRYAPNGDLSHCDAVDIASAALWEGDEEVFVSALIECRQSGKHGFLERTPTGKLIIHDWHQYGGKILINRFCDKYRKNNKGCKPTDAEIRDAGLIPSEMWGNPLEISGKEALSETFQTFPTESTGKGPVSEDFQRSVAQRSVTEPIVAQQQRSVAHADTREALPSESVPVPGPPRAAAAATEKEDLVQGVSEPPGEFVRRVLALKPEAWKSLLSSRWETEFKAGRARAEWPFKARILRDLLSGAEPEPEALNKAPPPPKRVQVDIPFPGNWFPDLDTETSQRWCKLAYRKLQSEDPSIRPDDDRVRQEALTLIKAGATLTPKPSHASVTETVPITRGPESAGRILSRVLPNRKAGIGENARD